jgi:hypothetical protein
MIRYLFLLIMLASCSRASVRQDSLLRFELIHSSAKEKKVASELQNILKGQRLEALYFSRTIIVDETQTLGRTISRDVSLGTQYQDGDLLLSEFIRRQFHVFLNLREPDVVDATAVIRRVLPPLPLGAPNGFKTQADNTFALLVGLLELRALKNSVGTASARDLLLKRNYMPEFYRVVFANEQALTKIAHEHNLIPEE